jgi:sirohydrochlorin cobaltochelatase
MNTVRSQMMMTLRSLSLRVTAAVLLVSGVATAQPVATAQQGDRPGVLLLAHGGAKEWNERVGAVAATIAGEQPVEVALGMASKATIQSGIDKLVARGVTNIVAVPLFVSSHSSVITSTQYLLGLRESMPADLKIFAKMSHGPAGEHAAHGAAPANAEDNLKPVKSPVPIRMTDALNHHPLVGAILLDRAKAISTDPAHEAVVLVAHGPVPEDDNNRWLADMKVLAEQMKGASSYASIDYLTVRDDAPKPMRDQAAAELRAIVQKRIDEKRRVLIVPVLLSFGGVERGVRQRLEGLDYVMAPQGLMPDDRLVNWVRAMASSQPAPPGK